MDFTEQIPHVFHWDRHHLCSCVNLKHTHRNGKQSREKDVEFVIAIMNVFKFLIKILS